ncbi:Protein of unknown function [Gryllus bimaculatus]|nr:Protein of unknown function [Gryllus bimaculatus]
MVTIKTLVALAGVINSSYGGFVGTFRLNLPMLPGENEISVKLGVVKFLTMWNLRAPPPGLPWQRPGARCTLRRLYVVLYADDDARPSAMASLRSLLHWTGLLNTCLNHYYVTFHLYTPTAPHQNDWFVSLGMSKFLTIWNMNRPDPNHDHRHNAVSGIKERQNSTGGFEDVTYRIV